MRITTDKGAAWQARYVIVITDGAMPEVVVEVMNDARLLSDIAREAEEATTLKCVENVAETRLYDVKALRSITRSALQEGQVQLRFVPAQAQ